MHKMNFQYTYNVSQAEREPSQLAAPARPQPGQNDTSRHHVSNAAASRDGSRSSISKLALLLVFAFTFCFTASLHAQFPGGGFQFGGGQNNNRSRTSTSGGQYPNNQVGDAVI